MGAISTGSIVGIIAGSLSGAVCLFGVLIGCCYRWRRLCGLPLGQGTRELEAQKSPKAVVTLRRLRPRRRIAPEAVYPSSEAVAPAAETARRSSGKWHIDDGIQRSSSAPDCDDSTASVERALAPTSAQSPPAPAQPVEPSRRASLVRAPSRRAPNLAEGSETQVLERLPERRHSSVQPSEASRRGSLVKVPARGAPNLAEGSETQVSERLPERRRSSVQPSEASRRGSLVKVPARGAPNLAEGSETQVSERLPERRRSSLRALEGAAAAADQRRSSCAESVRQMSRAASSCSLSVRRPSIDLRRHTSRIAPGIPQVPPDAQPGPAAKSGILASLFADDDEDGLPTVSSVKSSSSQQVQNSPKRTPLRPAPTHVRGSSVDDLLNAGYTVEMLKAKSVGLSPSELRYAQLQLASRESWQAQAAKADRAAASSQVHVVDSCSGRGAQQTEAESSSQPRPAACRSPSTHLFHQRPSSSSQAEGASPARPGTAASAEKAVLGGRRPSLSDAARLHDAGVDAARRARALKTMNYSASEMYEAGFKASELLQAGFTAAEVRLAGASAAEMKEAGVDATALHAEGFTATELAAAGFSIVRLMEAGYSFGELREAGFHASELKIHGATISDLFDAGYSKADVKRDSVGLSLSELKATSRRPSRAAPSSRDAPQPLAQPADSQQAEAESSSQPRLAACRSPSTHLFHQRPSSSSQAEGASPARPGTAASAEKAVLGGRRPSLSDAARLHDAGVDAARRARALKTMNYSASEMYEAGFKASELLQAGFTAAEVRLAGASAAEMKEAGVDATALHAEGFTATELAAAGFSIVRLMEAGYSFGELREAGFHASELKIHGATISDLFDAGYSKADVKRDSVGLSLSELKATSRRPSRAAPSSSGASQLGVAVSESLDDRESLSCQQGTGSRRPSRFAPNLGHNEVDVSGAVGGTTHLESGRPSAPPAMHRASTLDQLIGDDDDDD